MMNVVSDEGAACLRVTGEMTVYHAAELATALLRPLAEAAAPAVDLEGVTELDCAGVQVLLVAARDARARGCALQIARPSRVVGEVCETLGLASLLAEARVEGTDATELEDEDGDELEDAHEDGDAEEMVQE